VIQSSYDDIKHQLQVGDVLFFGGKSNLWPPSHFTSGFISGGIELFTQSPISHAATVISREDDTPQYKPAELVESTTLNGFTGAQRSPADWRVSTYEGRVWWAPLSEEVRARFDEAAFVKFTLAIQGHPYDYKAVAAMMWEPLASIPAFHFLMNKEDLSRVYCSEYVCAGFEAAGVMGKRVDFAECSPQDLAKKRIYGNLVQLRGDLKAIPNFNTIDVDLPEPSTSVPLQKAA
jgi:hypothetical protein